MDEGQVFLSQPYLQFLNEKAFLVPNWKWAVLGLGLAIGLALYPVFSFVIQLFKSKFKNQKRLPQFLAEFFELRIEKNSSWILVALIWFASVDAAHMPEKIDQYLNIFLQLVLIVNVFGILYLAIEAFAKVLATRAALTESTLDDQLVPFASKGLKAIVILLGGLLTLQSFGVNVNSVLAGIGIGGMAVAFAAQESIAALFGSIVILIDSPFKLGDLVRVCGIEGTIEHIGFRSTRIRLMDDTLMVIPNSTMAKENINNIAERKRRRINQVLGIVYETDLKKIEEFMEQIRYSLMQHELVDKQNVTVTFSGFGDFSLSIKVVFYILSPQIEVENKVQSEIYLEFFRISQNLGVSFAYPTQTVHHVQSPAPMP